MASIFLPWLLPMAASERCKAAQLECRLPVPPPTPPPCTPPTHPFLPCPRHCALAATLDQNKLLPLLIPLLPVHYCQPCMSNISFKQHLGISQGLESNRFRAQPPSYLCYFPHRQRFLCLTQAPSPPVRPWPSCGLNPSQVCVQTIWLMNELLEHSSSQAQKYGRTPRSYLGHR